MMLCLSPLLYASVWIAPILHGRPIVSQVFIRLWSTKLEKIVFLRSWECGGLGAHLWKKEGVPCGNRHWIAMRCCRTPNCSCFLCQEAWLAPTCKTHVYTESKGSKSISIYPLWSSSTWHECVKVPTNKLSWTIRLCFVDSKWRNPIGQGVFMEGSTNHPN